MTSKNIFQKVGMLEKLNPLNKENWNFETKFLIKTIKPNLKTVMFVNCQNGRLEMVKRIMKSEIINTDIWVLNDLNELLSSIKQFIQ